MPDFRLLLAGLLLGAPLATLAQSSASPRPKFYVGLAAYISNYQPIGSNAGTGFRLPLQATLGYQWRPRLAVEMGLAYRGNTYDYAYSSHEYLGNGQFGVPYDASGIFQHRTLAASLLGRYTLTRQAAHRLQVDVLAGLKVEYYRNSTNETRTDSAAAPVANTYVYHVSKLLATAGLGLRYHLGQHLEATYNLLYSSTLDGLRGSKNYDDRDLSMALGLRYRFGSR